MQWLARYPSCPGDCMMRWQYLAKQSCSRCWLLTWTTEEVYYGRDGFYWWLCRSMRRPASTSVWMALPCFTSWVSIAHMRICACEHMRLVADEPTGTCLQGRVQMVWVVMQKEERIMTALAEPLLARIFGWWADGSFYFFPNWVLWRWLFASVLRAFYEVAGLSGIRHHHKERSMLDRTSSCSCQHERQWAYSIFPKVVYIMTIILEGLYMLAMASSFMICWRRGVWVRIMHLNLFLLLDVATVYGALRDGFSQCGFTVNN